MKNLFFVALAALSLTACSENETESNTDSFGMQSASAEYLAVCSTPVQTVAGNITVSTTWTANRIWEIDGIVNVPSGVTLTIEPGTYIKAKPNANGATGVLVVQKGGKLIANGTATAPIVFTSYKLLDCSAATTASPGDFGGIVILGDAPANTPATTTIEGLTGSQYYYGGTNAAHNGGSLKYVRIEFAGYDLLAPNSGNEINGLTLGGVGSGTTIDHVQVSYGKDDSFEFFGGTVNATNLVSFAADDDNFDFDSGYTGTITCALALANQNSTHSLSGGSPDSNGIELDNNAAGSAATPFTRPVINNLTIVGARTGTSGALYENAIHVRRNGKLTLNNAVVTGYPVGILLETVASAPVNLADLSFTGGVSAHGFTFATASKIGSTTAALTIPGVTATSTSNPAAVWGMTQPFFNTPGWNVTPRNCGDFQGTWTKYAF
ncbi:hypothetical protein [Flavobacterium fluviatile]|uniref:hypothetical protein n=1 Tax=Flavobacterium fluviatile TaxID=1862387 RepID=UPI0013D1156D|nr:hypothetical protein [Flavobacterium fluviatile]